MARAYLTYIARTYLTYIYMIIIYLSNKAIGPNDLQLCPPMTV